MGRLTNKNFEAILGSSERLNVTPSSGFLGPGDPPACEIVNGDGDSPFVLSCDHASAAIPGKLDGLGLAPELLELHIASDLGAGALTRRLAAHLNASAVLCGYSRLLIDCNRYLADPTAIRLLSDGHPVPGNQALSQADRDQRVKHVRIPYHQAIASELKRRQRDGFVPGLICVHSFTPRLDGFERPWHVGILWDRDPRLAQPLLAQLRALPGLCVGDNEPYSGRHPADYTVDHHGERGGRPCVSLEIRQDLLASEAGVEEWAERLARPLLDLVSKPEIFVKQKT